MAEAEKFVAEPDAFDGLDLCLVMSHFACADEKDHALTAAQIDRFAFVRALFPQVQASLAASSGIFRGPAARFDLVRPGCALYGVNPTPEAPNPMVPVCRLEARVLQLREIGPSETIGYGATFRAAHAMRTATIAAGYADGVLRSLGNLGYAHAAGFRAPIVGRISMDLITVDVTALPAHAVQVGDWVTLLGPERPVDSVAADAGTIGYEILTRIAPRALRVAGPL
jgi:alanine racemase